MWSSIPRTNRVCAFCRQQRRRRISTTRNSSTPPTLPQQQRQQHRASRLTLTPRPLTCLPPVPYTPSVATRQLFTRSARSESSQPSAGPSSATGTDAESRVVPQTHYDFFPKSLPDGPPPRGHFKLDVRALRREFLTLQAGAHPDLHPSHMKARAQATSARINEAFRTLESPLLRAQYILALRGLDVANDETAKVEDPELLMLVLETRECIEEAEEEGELEGLKVENEERIRECEDRLERLFAADELDAAAAEVVRLRYWVNVRESINNWEKGKPVVLQH
ncbi:Co-chaperone Hsc20 [Xylaria intraflava]|nr:Co-chaperone Hsc20 [Xylaria intraflava]